MKRATREDEHHAQPLEPGGESPFGVLLNSTLLAHYTGVPAARSQIFFRGAGYPEHFKTSLSHRQSIPKPLAIEGSSQISANLASLAKYTIFLGISGLWGAS